MIIAAEYSFNNGERLRNSHSHLLTELEEIIARVDSSIYKTKKSEEVNMKGKLLYSPGGLNKAYKREFLERGWRRQRVTCHYSSSHYRSGYRPKRLNRGAYREIDFLKEDVGVEVQFGKYAFMVYNVCAKMTIFSNLGHINIGVEIVPVKAFADEMSSGVSYFEQFVWDLEARGVADIDIPVLIFGIDA